MNTTKLCCALYRLVLLFGWGLFLLLGQTTAAQTCTGEVLNIATTTPSQTGTMGSWTVPSGGPYKIRITAKGAKGGNSAEASGGAGAIMIGDFFVSQGQILEASVGALGASQSSTTRVGGGAGSGVRIQSGSVLLVAGGGGGATHSACFGHLAGGSATTTAGNGNGGNGGNGGGGGGLNTNGSNGVGVFGGSTGGGSSGINADGGVATGNTGDVGTTGGGGYGGGGAGEFGGGGGGGYSGGNASVLNANPQCSNFTQSSGGGSINWGINQNNSILNNAGGQVIIECLGTATYSATVTSTQPSCVTPTQGSVSIDLTDDLNGFTSGGLEYAIVAGNSFTGTPTFADVTADPLNVTSGVGTTVGAYTVRIRLKYNPTVYVDKTYTLTRPFNCTY